jgi:uncharacterized OB-fold protein
MSYTNDFVELEKQGKVKPMSAGIIKLDADTQSITGKVIGVTSKTFAGLGKPTKVAVIDTDEGEAFLLAGVIVTNFCENPANAGKLVRITWIGKVHEGEGGEYNKYLITIAGD